MFIQRVSRLQYFTTYENSENMVQKIERYFALGIIVLGALLCSCKGDMLQQQLLDFLDEEVTFPTMVKYSQNAEPAIGRPALDPTLYTLVMYFDSTQCSSCRIGRMYEWREIVEYSQDSCNLVVVFSPGKTRLPELQSALRTEFFETDVWVDESGDFARANECIPADKRLHTFLLDPSHNVMLAGDPVYNQQMWNLYKATIRE